LSKLKTPDYRDSHTGPNSSAIGYDENWRFETFDSIVWEREKNLLKYFMNRYVMKKQRYLDFACGTGRILHHLEDQFDSSIGVDISSNMLNETCARVCCLQDLNDLILCC